MAAVVVPVLRKGRSNRRYRKTGGQQDETEATTTGSEPVARCWDCFFPKEKSVDASKNAPVSFHLRLQFGPNFTHKSMSSVQFLRLPFLKSFPNADSHNLEKSEAEALAKAAGTRYEVFIRRVKHVPIPGEKNSKHGIGHGASQDSPDTEHHVHRPPELSVEELLIATDKRLFIVLAVSDNTGENSKDGEIMKGAGVSGFWASSCQLEIVESIPLEEVDTISMWKEDEAKDVNTVDRGLQGSKSLSELFFECFGSFVECFSQQASNDSSGTTVDDSFLSKFSDEHAAPFEGGLKITTSQKSAFHRGRPFYFMVKKDSWNTTTPPKKSKEKDNAKSKEKDNAQEHTRHLHKVCRKLKVLADKRKRIYARENRFQLLQETLQAMWDSIPFNILVLLLIVSNFVFTVLQLENKDPSQQPFYETVDLVYTIIFCAGNAPFLPPYLHLFISVERI
jgi:hypothetical protein